MYVEVDMVGGRARCVLELCNDDNYRYLYEYDNLNTFILILLFVGGVPNERERKAACFFKNGNLE